MMKRMLDFNVCGEDEITNNQPNVADPDYFKFILDNSGSMDSYEHAVRSGLHDYKERLLSIDEATSIYVSRADFTQSYQETDYLPIDKFSSKYRAYGLTDLYGAIVKSTKSTIKAYENLIAEGYEPRMTNIVFSDGEHYLEHMRDEYDIDAAKKIVQEAVSMGITMVFIDFGGRNGDIPKYMGFQSIYAPENSLDALTDTIRDITNSCIRQSQSKISNSSDWLVN